MADDLKFGLSLEPNLDELEKSWAKQEAKIQKIIDKRTYQIKVEGTQNLDKLEAQLKRITEMQNRSAKPLTAYRAGQLDIQREVALRNQQATQIQLVNIARQKEAQEVQRTAKVQAQAEAAQLRLNQAQMKGLKTTKASTKAFQTQAGVLNGMKQFVNSYFSILGAKRIIDNVRDITSEFELQRVSLRALTQDAQFAYDLFAKIKASAVESPFSVKDMLTYTKQLAAYRFENEELYETMNRLADVSAGLGVDMSRLILAVGQVKAASVLRGQELRQFTESGIPLVDELAKKFTKLRGEMVTTGEVFELISKREVPFEMVADIFKEMTEEGGRFYNMQKKQAESLYGVYENLTDKIQIAMDEVGQSNRGLFMDVGKALGFLAENLSSVTSGFGAALTVVIAHKVAIWGLTKYYAALTASQLESAKAVSVFRKALYATTGVAKGLSAAIKSIPVIGWITAGISALITVVDVATRKQREYNARLKETLTTLTGSINGIHGYVSELQNLNREESEYQEVVNKLSDVQDLSVEQQNALAKANSELTTIDRRRTEILGQLSQVDESFARQIKDDIIDTQALSNAEAEYVAQLRIRYSLEKEIGKDRVAQKGEALNEANSRELQKQSDLLAKMGDVYEKVNRELAENKNLTEEETAALQKFLSSEKNFIEAYGDLVKDLRVASANRAGGRRNLTAAMFDVSGSFDLKAFQEYEKALRHTSSALTDFEKGAEKTIKDILKHADVNAALKQIASDDVDEDTKRKLRNQVIDVFTQAFDARGITGIARATMQKVFSSLTGIKWGKEADPVSLLPWQEDLKNLSALGYQKDIDAAQARFVDIADEVKKKYKEVKAEFKQLDALTPAQRETNKLNSSYEKLKIQMQEIKDFASEYHISLTDKGDTAQLKDNIQKLQQEYDLIKEIRQRYEALKKSMSDESAAKAVGEMYDNLTEIDFLSPEGLKERLKKLQQEAKALGDNKLSLKIGLAIQDIEFEELKKKLQKKLADISQQISRSKAGADLFQSMLGLTGDEKLSTNLTIALTGIDVTGQNIRQQLAEQLAAIISDESIAPEVQANLGIEPVSADGGNAEAHIKHIADMIKQGTIQVESFDKLIASIDDKTLKNNLESALKEYMDYNTEMLKNFLTTINKAGDSETQRRLLKSKKDTQMSPTNRAMFEAMRPTNVTSKEWTEWVDAYFDAIQTKYNEDIAKLDFEDFKKKFAETLADMDAASVSVLSHIIKELKGFLTLPDIDATMMKSIQELIDRAQNVKIDKAPLTALKEAWDAIIDASSKASRQQDDAANAQVVAAKQKLQEAKAAEMTARLEVQNAQTVLDNTTTEQDEAAAQASLLRAQNKLKEAKATKEAANAALKDAEATQKATKATKEAAKAKALNDMKKAVSSIKSKWDGVASAISSIIDATEEVADALGLAFSDETKEAIEGFETGVGLVTTAFTAMVAVLAVVEMEVITLETLLWPLLVIALALGAAFAAIKFISAQQEKQHEEALKKIDDKLKAVKLKLDALKETEDSLVGEDWVKNQVAQIKSLSNQISLLNAKINEERFQGKKADKEEIEEWEDEIRDLQKEMRELTAGITEAFAGTDLASAAKDFAKSWLDAYLSFGNTTDAIKEKFQDMMRDMIVNSVLARVVQQKLKPIFDYIDNELYDRQSGALIGSLDTIWAMMKRVTDTLPGELESIYKNMGEWAGELRTSESSLTGIAKGVSQASEESVVTLSGYANSILYYHVLEATDISAIRAILEGRTVVSPNVEQPVASDTSSLNVGQLISIQQDTLAQIMLIKQDTTAIRDDIAEMRNSLNSVISGAGSQSAKTVNIRFRQ